MHVLDVQEPSKTHCISMPTSTLQDATYGELQHRNTRSGFWTFSQTFKKTRSNIEERKKKKRSPPTRPLSCMNRPIKNPTLPWHAFLHKTFSFQAEKSGIKAEVWLSAKTSIDRYPPPSSRKFSPKSSPKND